MFSIRYTIGILISLAFLIVLISQIHIEEMITSFKNANYAYLIPGIIIYFVSLYFRSIRWKYLLAPFEQIKTKRLYPVLLVGYLANNVLPLRAGELIRSYYLAKRENISTATGLATILVERVFDGITLITFILFGGFFLPIFPLFSDFSTTLNLPNNSLLYLVIGAFLLVLVLIVLVGIIPNLFIQGTVNLIKILPKNLRRTAIPLIERFYSGFIGMNKPSRLFNVFFLSLPVWIAEACMYFIIGYGFGIDSFFSSLWEYCLVILVVVSASNLATAIPSSQGSVGPFEVFATMALIYLGVSNGIASAYVIILHLSLLFPVIIVGIGYMFYASLSLKQLTGEASE